MESGSFVGLRYRLSIPAFLAARAAGRWLPGLLASGRVPGLSLDRLPRRPLPGPDWLRLRPLLSGICGTDLALLSGRSSPALSPFTSFPAVLGHEVVARVSEVGPAVKGIAAGQRVVVDPFLSCAVRGLEPCDPCRRGEACLCTRAAEGRFGPAMLLGYCRALPGAWSEEMLAHRSQVYLVPERVSDTAAVLVEPLSVALHAALKQRPPAESTVLVLGGGTLGLCLLAALRLLGHAGRVALVARYPFQARLAERLGASHAVLERQGGAGAAAEQLVRARRYQPALGGPVYLGGFDWVFDCVGSRSSLDQALRVAGPGGRVVLVGCAGEIARLDWTFVWSRELQVLGCCGYAREPSLEGQPHTFEVALRLLAERPDYPVAELASHRVPLRSWRQALRAALDRGGHSAVKVLFDCQAGAG